MVSALEKIWSRAAPEIVGGVVAGLVLLIVPPLAELLAGITVRVNPLYIFGAFLAGALSFALYRAAVWLRAEHRGWREAQQAIQHLEGRYALLVNLVPVEEVVRYAESEGWDVEVDDRRLKMTHKSEMSQQSTEISTGPGETPLTDGAVKALILGSVERELADPIRERVRMDSTNGGKPAEESRHA